MKPNRHDIGDDEIRIIVNDSKPTPVPRPPYRRLLVCITAAIALIAMLLLLLTLSGSPGDDDLVIDRPVSTDQLSETAVMPDSSGTPVIEIPTAVEAFTGIADTIIGRHGFVIMTPVNATPILRLGAQALDDSTAVLVAEAAGVRNDNGQIVGACVIDGQLLSKGQSKSGFCAIINGVMTIGVADTTPLLEQALETDGYFFRQYPLVVGGQVVENKPKGKSLRKALADYNGSNVIIMSKEPLTFHDFSTALVGLGVSNAIYLIGSSSGGFARTADGECVTFGKLNPAPPVNTTYIVWR